LLAAHGDATAERIEAVAREARGWPFLLRELAHHPGATVSSVDEMLAERIARLPEAARRMLDVVAVAGQPIERAVAEAAAALGQEAPAALALLRRERLVRVRTRAAAGELESYHDRIREAAVARLDPGQRRTLHLGLATALEASGRADAETLFVHLREAGEQERAAELAARAADEAMRVLGFERAARLYRETLDLGATDRSSLHGRLADALACAGRGSDAAHAYLAAMEGADAATADELRRRASEQLLFSGRFDEGVAVLRDVLAAAGVGYPASRLLMLVLLVATMLRLWLRGLSFQERPAEQVDAATLRRIDVCRAACAGLSMVDILPSAYFQRRFVLMALQAGEPRRAAAALSQQILFTAASGGLVEPAAAVELRQRTKAMVERLGDPHLQAFHAFNLGTAHMLRGRLPEAREQLELATRTLAPDLGAWATFERTLARAVLLDALHNLGDWPAMLRLLDECDRDGEERGDLLVLDGSLRSAGWRALLADEPSMVIEEVAARMRGRDERDGAVASHRFDVLCAMRLYEQAGRGGDAWAFVCAERATLRAADVRLFRLMHLRLGLMLSGAAALAAGRLDDAARRASAALRVRHPLARPVGQWLQAGVAAARGEPERALALVAEAEAAYATLGFMGYATALKRRRGALLGGDEGRALVEDADAWFSARGAKDPARFAATLVPGTWGQES
jgi:tetratricopeptide (TPR) repeat protein